MSNKVRIYEDDKFVIEIFDKDGINPEVRITAFENYHYCDDISISYATLLNDDLINTVKDILYI